jgi:hypothetical protein
MGMVDLIALFPRIISHRITLRYTTTMKFQLLHLILSSPPP